MIRKQHSSRLLATCVSPWSALAPLAPLTPPTLLAPNSFVSVKGIYLRKNLGCFAYFYPSNSFIINKTISETAKNDVKLGAIDSPQPLCF
jgi:hypothetical protein